MRFLFLALSLSLVAAFSGAATESRPLELGPLVHEFPLTLQPGQRAEALGPFLVDETTTNSHLRSFGPFYVRYEEPGSEYSQTEVLYPLFSLDRVGGEYRWNVLELFSAGGGNKLDTSGVHRTTLFPIYFSQKGEGGGTNDYFAILPFYGTIRNRLFRDEIHFVMMPLYVETRKKDVITDNYLAPFFHIRSGGAQGWQLWPLYGTETRAPQTRTNIYTDALEVVPGHEKQFILWPLWFDDRLQLGTTNQITNHIFLPFYSLTRSPSLDQSTYLFPFFSVTEDREKHFKEYGMPWPFIGWADGEGKHARRFWPLWGKATNAILESDFVLWPGYTHRRLISKPLDREQYRILFYLYRDVRERDLQSGNVARRVGLWPFFTFHRDLQGRERLQALALTETILPTNSGFARGWAPLWSLYRSEFDPVTHLASQSLLWNLWRRDISPQASRTSCVFGMIRTEKSEGKRHWSFFWTGLEHASAEPNPHQHGN